MATCTVLYVASDGVPRYKSMANQESLSTEAEGCLWRGLQRHSSLLQDSPWVGSPRVACWSSLTKVANILRSLRYMPVLDQRLLMLSAESLKELGEGVPESSKLPGKWLSRPISSEEPETPGHSSDSVSHCRDGPKGSEGGAAYYRRMVRTIISACKAMHWLYCALHCWDLDLLFGTCAVIEGHL